MKTCWLLVPVLLMIASCAQVTATRGSSYTDPSYARAPLSSIIVDARTNLSEREALERSTVAVLRSAGVAADASLDVAPPTRDTGEKIHRRTIMNTGAQAVLEIVPQEKQIVRSFIPGSHYDSFDRWHHNHYRDPFYEPSLVLEEPQARYEARLYRLPGYDTVWTADLTTRGPTGMSFEQVGANFGRELVERMAADGLVPPLQ